jgi:uncharacterized protein (DUF1810 family)
MTDPFDLEWFVAAQEPLFESVLSELRAGRKRTYWMWFVFPQLRGLGHSSMTRSLAGHSTRLPSRGGHRPSVAERAEDNSN